MNVSIGWHRLRSLWRTDSSEVDDGARGAIAARYVALVHRFESFSLRERALLVAGAAVLSMVLWDVFAMQPLYTRERAARSALNEIAPSGASDFGDLSQLVDAERELNKQLAQRRRELERGAASLIDPARMPDVLTGVIASTAGLKLLRLSSLQPEELRAADAGAAEGQTAVLDTDVVESEAEALTKLPAVAYVHGIEIAVQGDYRSIHEFVRTLERQPWRFIWRKLELTVDEYPTVRATIVVATLGLERQWLSL